MSDDIFAAKRRNMARVINAFALPKEELAKKIGEEVYDHVEVHEHFKVTGFAAPFCIATRLSDGERGVLLFQHNPRIYFQFQATTNKEG